MHTTKTIIDTYVHWLGDEIGLKLGYHRWGGGHAGSSYQLFVTDEQGREAATFGRVSNGSGAFYDCLKILFDVQRYKNSIQAQQEIENKVKEEDSFFFLDEHAKEVEA